MNNIYNHTNLSEIENHPEFLRMRKLADTTYNSVRYNEIEAKEIVSKTLLNAFGYPNNIEIYIYQGSSKVEFVNVVTNEILACVETVNDGMVFYTVIRYYGDWWK